MFELLFDPDGFFANHVEGDGLLGPATVVTAVGVAGLASPLVVLESLLNGLGAEAGYFLVGYGIGLVGTFLGPFLEWMLLSLGFYAISTRFGGRGPVRRVVRLVGWGFVPATLTGLVMTAAMLVTVQRIAPPTDPAGALRFVRLVQTAPAVRLAILVGIAFTVWSGLLWVFAVKHARGLSVRHAIPTVTVPVLVVVGWRLIHVL